MSITLLRLPNSAGINPVKWFLLKFLPHLIFGVSEKSNHDRRKNAKERQYNSQLQKMFQITKWRRNGATNFVIRDVPKQHYQLEKVNKNQNRTSDEVYTYKLSKLPIRDSSIGMRPPRLLEERFLRMCKT